MHMLNVYIRIYIYIRVCISLTRLYTVYSKSKIHRVVNSSKNCTTAHLLSSFFDLLSGPERERKKCIYIYPSDKLHVCVYYALYAVYYSISSSGSSSSS